jgi:hypothetical protein
MIKEGGKMMKRSGERIRGVLEVLGETGAWGLDKMIHPGATGGKGEISADEVTMSGLSVTSDISPFANAGPIPDELRKDPFPGGSVPWSIQEAEKEQGRARQTMIWKVAIAVSWSVTAVAVLRSVGML